MILISNVRFNTDFSFSDLKSVAANILKTDISNILSASLHKRSLDCRKKQDIHYICSLLVTLKVDEKRFVKQNKNISPYTPKTYTYLKCKKSAKSPVVVGFGPAGMFSALTLARAGLNPIVIERGSKVEKRVKDVEDFFSGNGLNENSNVQFGEGGAGTFSDGKLNTGIKDFRCRAVLEAFYEFGADEKILYEAKPHIGTDILVNVVKNLRNEIISLGGKILFDTKLCDILYKNSTIYGIEVENNGKTYNIECDTLVLAIGHSARDTFKMLSRKPEITLIRKPFSMGVRIEHSQELINKAQYTDDYKQKHLPPADYKLAVHLENGRGVYTFCMCPGGVVVNAASQKGTFVTNGMSYSLRDGKNANSALLVSVLETDLEGDDVLSGFALQEKAEKTAYQKTNGRGVPVQLVGDFLKDKASEKIGSITPTVRPNFVPCDIRGIYPSFITDSIKKALPLFANKLKGFDTYDAVLVAPETRSTCPVRIVRDNDTFVSSLKGLYPAGEGAGYAGGIMSAAVDGLRVAEAIINNINNVNYCTK